MGQKQRNKKLVRIADRVAKHLGVFRANAILFPVVAKALGYTWPDGKHNGYELVGEYARLHNLTTSVHAEPQLSRADVPVKRRQVHQGASRPDGWTPPKRKARFAQKDDFLFAYEWRRLRMEVIKERGTRCECCGHSPSDGVTVLNVDHIKPRKLHPELALDKANLQILCDACNHGKGNWDQTDWRHTVPGSDTVQ